MKDLSKQFQDEVVENIAALADDGVLHDLTMKWINRSAVSKYTYNFRWLGRPIIQYPQDMVAMQELIWELRPDLVIETGIAHGGSLIFSASMLAMLDMCDAIESASMLDPKASRRKVLWINIDFVLITVLPSRLIRCPPGS